MVAVIVVLLTTTMLENVTPDGPWIHRPGDEAGPRQVTETVLPRAAVDWLIPVRVGP